MIEQDAIVEFNQRVALDTFLIRFRALKMAEAARPGQFVMIRAGNAQDPLLRRPFSICRVQGHKMQVLYRVVGRGTRALSEKRAGEFLSVVGPLGRGFRFPGRKRQVILTGGGMGIAPLAFAAQSVRPRHHRFLVGFGSAEQMMDTRLLGLNRQINMVLATEDGSAGQKGLVTELLENELAVSKRATVFACGPTAMLKAVAAMTSRWNTPCQVSLESAMACGLGACQGCAVTAAPGKGRSYWHVCQDGPVFDADDLDWEAL